ncbi:MAG: Cysteine--tRNA ligase [bacterium ADurb.Bin400]|nr:MAG: Cysteine--tRNA ligase [bacterium ADurb.Bin400]
MKLYNTLSRTKEELIPLENGKVRFYSCGPTVYDIAHIGNLRTYIFNDLIKRVLRAGGFEVRHVMNITDVDDKTIKRSGGNRAELAKLTKRYEDRFWQDLKELNVLMPDEITRATEYIDVMVRFIEDLLRKGYAYRGADGSIYFSIDKFKDYGKLSGLEKEGVRAGARVNQDEYTKESPADFALWKAWDEADGEVYWENSLGKGRPGWHIECSAMASDALGETIDIHTGAVDLIFPHHENEIAQSEARSSKPFSKYWVHGEHLLFDNQKMAKSLGNVVNLDTIKDEGYSPLDFRYLVLGAHYRSKLNFTWEGMQAAKNSRERLVRIVSDLACEEGSRPDDGSMKEFRNKLFDDLDIPGALAVLWTTLRSEEMPQSTKCATVKVMDETLGLGLFEEFRKVSIPAEVESLAQQRLEARVAKDYITADKFREEIENLGWLVEDKASGYELRRK